MGSHENDFGVSAPEASVTPAVPLTRREAKALWEAEQKAAAKAAKSAPRVSEPAKVIEAAQVIEPDQVIEPVEISAAESSAVEAAAVEVAPADISPRSSSKPKLMAAFKPKTPKLVKAAPMGKLERASKPELSPRQRTARVTTMVAMAIVPSRILFIL